MNSVHEPGSQTMSKNRLRNNTESIRIDNRPSAPSAQPIASPRTQAARPAPRPRAQRPGRTGPARPTPACRALPACRAPAAIASLRVRCAPRAPVCPLRSACPCAPTPTPQRLRAPPCACAPPGRIVAWLGPVL